MPYDGLKKAVGLVGQSHRLEFGNEYEMSTLVRATQLEDIEQIAALHKAAFVRQKDSETWVKATWSAYPRMLTYVLVHDDELAGFIFWAQKSGIRPLAVVELDQVVVRPDCQGRGLGEQLIRESLSFVRSYLTANDQTLKSVLVSTRADNQAQRLYAKVLGARVVAEIDGLYSATEVFMLADDGAMN